MKLKHVLLFLTFAVVLFGQNQLLGQEQHAASQAASAYETSLSQHTLLMLEKHFTGEEIQVMNEQAPEKLRFLNYYFSASFQLKEGQSYSNDQIHLIDVFVHKDIRKQSETVEVFDEASGLFILLDSNETIGQQEGAPRRYTTPASTGKIAHP